MWFAAAPGHTQAHLWPKSWPFDSQRVCACLNVIFYLVNSNMLSKLPQTKAHVYLLWEMCTRACVRTHALLTPVVCEMKAIVIIFQSGGRLERSQAADRISALNALMSGPQSEFALIRTHETLLVALLRRITSCRWESWTVADTNKQEHEGEKGQKQGHPFKTPTDLIWGQPSDVMIHKLQPNFWHITVSQCART